MNRRPPTSTLFPSTPRYRSITIPTAEAVTSSNAVGIGAQEPPLRIEPKYASLIPNRDVNQFDRNAARLNSSHIHVADARIRFRHVAGNRRSASLACREPLDL